MFRAIIAATLLSVASTSTVSASTVLASTEGIEPNGGYGGFAVQTVTGGADPFSAFNVLMIGSSLQPATVTLSIYDNSEYVDPLLQTSVSGIERDQNAEFTFAPIEVTEGSIYYFYLQTTGYAFAARVDTQVDFYEGGKVIAGGGNVFEGRDDVFVDLVFAAFVEDSPNDDGTSGGENPINPVPLPAGGFLMLAGLGLLVGLRQR